VIGAAPVTLSAAIALQTIPFAALAFAEEGRWQDVLVAGYVCAVGLLLSFDILLGGHVDLAAFARAMVR
jgi:hypothetical protein